MRSAKRESREGLKVQEYTGSLNRGLNTSAKCIKYVVDTCSAVLSEEMSKFGDEPAVVEANKILLAEVLATIEADVSVLFNEGLLVISTRADQVSLSTQLGASFHRLTRGSAECCTRVAGYLQVFGGASDEYADIGTISGLCEVLGGSALHLSKITPALQVTPPLSPLVAHSITTKTGGTPAETVAGESLGASPPTMRC
ncbi:MAG: hypothetical protein P1U34_03145 [Coxiellaceae bacterium]|nr:hypothetical protein [Coxiellaceae bacterium]